MTAEDDSRKLLRCIARSEGLNSTQGRTKGYLPLYKHPLPVSETRFIHEDTLRKVLSCKLEFQAMAAISRGDAWTLEEIFMRGGLKTMKGKNGSSPIHLAVQMNSIDAVMVLINIGVDINEVNSMGFTPLFLAKSAGANQIEQLLLENGAKLVVDKVEADDPIVTVLDVHPEQTHGLVKSNINGFSTLPRKSTYY